MNRKIKDSFVKGIIYAATSVTLGILMFIVGFVVIKGASVINLDFITRAFNDKVSYRFVIQDEMPAEIDEKQILQKAVYDKKCETPKGEPVYIDSLGGALMTVEHSKQNENREQILITYVEDESPLAKSTDIKKNSNGIEAGCVLQSVNGEDVEGMALSEVVNLIENSGKTLKLKVSEPGGGIWTNIIMTLYMVILSLIIALPIGIFAALFMTEYAKPGKCLRVIRFATECLSGIPSIIFGLFGMAFFVVALKMQISLLSGSLTVAIILLPVIIRSTEEALKTVPDSYREGSLALGASQLQTVFKVVLPSAMPGITTAVLLSIGRVIGESAALMLTAGTVAQIPKTLFSPGSTLTVQAYYVAKEEGNIELACAIGIIIILIVIILNVISKVTSDRLDVTRKKQ